MITFFCSADYPLPLSPALLIGFEVRRHRSTYLSRQSQRTRKERCQRLSSGSFKRGKFISAIGFLLDDDVGPGKTWIDDRFTRNIWTDSCKGCRKVSLCVSVSFWVSPSQLPHGYGRHENEYECRKHDYVSDNTWYEVGKIQADLN